MTRFLPVSVRSEILLTTGMCLALLYSAGGHKVSVASTN